MNVLGARKAVSHKGDYGRVGILAGSLTMMGAAVLCAKAALRSGAGLVVMMTIPEAIPAINIHHPELIAIPMPSENGVLSESAADAVMLAIDIHKLTVLAIGPGIGQECTTQLMIKKLLLNSPLTIPQVIDADALNALTAEDTQALTQAVLTPHPGEFRRLFPAIYLDDTDDIRQTAAKTAAEFSEQVIVLKGHRSVIADPNEKLFVNETGNPGMATAGMGDVLTGIIASFIAQGLTLMEAAQAGTYYHGAAGDLAYAKKGIGLIASDIIEILPEVLRESEV